MPEQEAEELGQISAAARCEELIGKHGGMFVDCTALLSDLDPDKLTPEMLDKIAEHMLKQALGDNPQVVADVKRRLEAGETGCDGVRRDSGARGMSPLVVLEILRRHELLKAE